MTKRTQPVQKVKSFPALRLFLGLIYIGALSAGLFFLPRMAPALLQMEHWTADWRSALFADQQSSQHPGIAVITISEETLADYPYRSPIDRGLLTELVKFASSANAKALGLDIIFDQPTEAEKDQSLINAIKASGTPVVLGALDERVDLNQRQRAFQTGFLSMSTDAVGYLNVRHDADGAIRYTAPPAQETTPATVDPVDNPTGNPVGNPTGNPAGYRVSFAGRMAEAAGIKNIKSPDRISWLKPPKDGSDTFLKIPAQIITKFAADPDNPLSKNIAAKLNGKLVLIGADFNSEDRHSTPISKLTGENMTGVLIHAQILAQLLDGRRIHHLNQAYEWPILIFIAVIGLALGWRFRLKRFDFLVGLIATIVLIATDFFVFSQFRVILPFTTPFVAWILGVTGGYYLGNSFKGEAIED